MLSEESIQETIKEATENDGLLIALGKFPLDDTFYEGIYIAYPQSALTPFNTNSKDIIYGKITESRISYKLYEIGGYLTQSCIDSSRHLHRVVGNIDTTYISLYKWEQFLGIIKDINTSDHFSGYGFHNYATIYSQDYTKYLCEAIIEIHILLGRYYTKAIIPNYIREISGGKITLKDLVDSREKREELGKILIESIAKLREISKPGILTEKQKTELNSFIYRTKIELI